MIDSILEKKLKPNWEELAKVWPCFESRGTNTTMLDSLQDYFESPILYIGGGRGKYPSSIQKKGHALVVVDSSKAMRQAAVEEFQLSYIHGDILQLELPPSSFPTIISSTGVLDTMSDENRIKSLNKIFNALGPTGNFISFYPYLSERLRELGKYIPCLEKNFFRNKIPLEYWYQSEDINFLPTEIARTTLQKFFSLYDNITLFLQGDKKDTYHFLNQNLPDLDHLPPPKDVIKELEENGSCPITHTLFEEGNTAMYFARRGK